MTYVHLLCALVACLFLVFLALRLKGDVTAVFKVGLVAFALVTREKAVSPPYRTQLPKREKGRQRKPRA